MERIPEPDIVAAGRGSGNESVFRAFESMPDSISRKTRRGFSSWRKTSSMIRSFLHTGSSATTSMKRICRRVATASARHRLPNGEAFYEYRTRYFTTTQMTPDEIHRLGLNEVKRIRDEMQLVIDELEFEGSFDDFLNFLRTDPQFYYDTRKNFSRVTSPFPNASIRNSSNFSANCRECRTDYDRYRTTSPRTRRRPTTIGPLLMAAAPVTTT